MFVYIGTHIAVSILGFIFGALICKSLFRQWYDRQQPSQEDKSALERTALSAYTGTVVTRIKKEKIGDVFRCTIYFDYELEEGTQRSTYVVVEDETMNSFEFTSLVITAINKVTGK